MRCALGRARGGGGVVRLDRGAIITRTLGPNSENTSRFDCSVPREEKKQELGRTVRGALKTMLYSRPGPWPTTRGRGPRAMGISRSVHLRAGWNGARRLDPGDQGTGRRILELALQLFLDRSP